MTTIQELKQQQTIKHSELFKECSLFFAFSNEQFTENKTPLQEGEKYVSIGAGGYLPKSKLPLLDKGLKEIKNWYKSEVKKSKNWESEILYELNNYECFYVNDITDAYNVLKDRYSLKQVQTVYYKNKERIQSEQC
jgi:hypothetical protein